MPPLLSALEHLLVGDSLTADTGARIDHVDAAPGFPTLLTLLIPQPRPRLLCAARARRAAARAALARFVETLDWSAWGCSPPARWHVSPSGSEDNPCWDRTARVSSVLLNPDTVHTVRLQSGSCGAVQARFGTNWQSFFEGGVLLFAHHYRLVALGQIEAIFFSSFSPACPLTLPVLFHFPTRLIRLRSSQAHVVLLFRAIECF